MKLEDLTESEKAMILDHRKKEVEKKCKFEYPFKIIRTLADYNDWLFKNKRGSSFSTFVNEFGYEDHDCKFMYKVFGNVMDLADSLTDDLDSETLDKLIDEKES